ncbi:histidinol-phosphate transaminase [Fulvivirga sedimenti]|uniref:Histidinol-phosphate aminotransferase n=1 Tax=Fulvivirga sedimenti TaxID=2879465 RepID=A0A9X1L0Q3_9BACT|nr:histidinol-phosphate transaminase [Fulvivirga sedimenti]MCA6075172.1 histidinol-phosphate transaminase [Fulvivirga sedimenti]MCA6076349.1 histidinol-phosphate transaminase [Fulvivirga sedimenti]MCA6077477.1 histidinol-phosphate transaminase [Fulvivirga sedimenti]
MELDDLIRPNILAMKPYSSARDEFSGQAGIFLDANENPNETGLNRYPDPYQKEIKRKLSALKGVAENRIFLGNGSDEPIDLLIRIFCRPGVDSILILDPTYGMYQVAAAVNDVTVIKAPLTENFELDPETVLSQIQRDTKIIFLCSPNNPSGNLLSKTAMQRIMGNFTGIVVVDEAYIDFTDDPGFIDELDKYPHLVVLQTFSKAWGMAGLRVGMAFASERIIQLLNKVKPPYNINILSQQKILNALENPENVKTAMTEIISQRSWLREHLANHPSVEKIYPSDSNFLLIRFRDAQKIFRELLSLQIITRDRSSVLHGSNCLRITVGTPEENKKLVEALFEMT